MNTTPSGELEQLWTFIKNSPELLAAMSTTMRFANDTQKQRLRTLLVLKGYEKFATDILWPLQQYLATEDEKILQQLKSSIKQDECRRFVYLSDRLNLLALGKENVESLPLSEGSKQLYNSPGYNYTYSTHESPKEGALDLFTFMHLPVHNGEVELIDSNCRILTHRTNAEIIRENLFDEILLANLTERINSIKDILEFSDFVEICASHGVTRISLRCRYGLTGSSAGDAVSVNYELLFLKRYGFPQKVNSTSIAKYMFEPGAQDQEAPAGDANITETLNRLCYSLAAISTVRKQIGLSKVALLREHNLPKNKYIRKYNRSAPLFRDCP